ncbi:MAG: hypothetical protein IIA41_15560 [SAR324 cluster bacterium]|nr:hypothetical protein [SAR324 cluster bacterium]
MDVPIIFGDQVAEGITIQFAVDASGNAIAVWRQGDGAVSADIWANRFVFGQGWGNAEWIEMMIERLLADS